MKFFWILFLCLLSHASLEANTPSIKKEILPSFCHTLFEEAEKKHGILPHLLKAVAHVESGRWDPESKQNTAWPWTITVKGKGCYFKTKEEAVAEIYRLKKLGIKDFDVGIMQINNFWHKGAFSTPEEALDPATNIQYGAKFLKDLFVKYKSWTRAIACYHSHNPKYNKIYCKKVMVAWGKQRTQSSEKLIRQNKKKPFRHKIIFNRKRFV